MAKKSGKMATYYLPDTTHELLAYTIKQWCGYTGEHERGMKARIVNEGISNECYSYLKRIENAKKVGAGTI